VRIISAAGLSSWCIFTFADRVPEQPAEELHHHHGFKISNLKFEIQNLFLLHGPQKRVCIKQHASVLKSPEAAGIVIAIHQVEAFPRGAGGLKV